MENIYADDHIEQMRVLLAEHWAENVESSALTALLLNGNEGYKTLEEDTLKEEFELLFGQNYFWQD
jgi:hypothetical protein